MTGEGWLPGYIQDYDGQALTLVVPFSDSEFLQTHDVTECSVRVGMDAGSVQFSDVRYMHCFGILQTGQGTSRRS